MSGAIKRLTPFAVAQARLKAYQGPVPGLGHSSRLRVGYFSCPTYAAADEAFLADLEILLISSLRHSNGAPMFAEDGTLLDERGNRSIFDYVDQ